MNTSGSFSLKRTWKNTSGSDTYDEITTKRLKSDYVSGISQDYFNLSNPIIGPPNTQLDGNEKPGQLRFKYYTEVQKGLLQVYDGSEWVSLNELEDSSLWRLSDNVVNIKNNYKVNLTNGLIVKGDLIVKDIRIPSAMTFYANTSTDPIISYAYYDSQLGQYVSTASINLYSGNISANIFPKSVLPGNHIKTNENGEIVAAPNSVFLSSVDQNLSKTSNVHFNNIKIDDNDVSTVKLSIAPGVMEQKILLHGTGSSNNFYGFGISLAQMNYHVRSPWGSNVADHVFYSGGTNGDGTELLRIKGDGQLIGYSNSKDINNTGLKLQNNYVFNFGDGLGVGNKIAFYHNCQSDRNDMPESGTIEVKRESNVNYADTFLQIHLIRSENRSTGGDRQLKKALQLNSLGELEVNELFLKNLIISSGEYPLMLTGEDRVVKYASSKKYKENIKTISPDISDDILNLNIKEFNYIDTPEKKSIGYIAEEVHELCPNIREYIISYLPVDKIPEKYKNKLQTKDIYTKNKEEVTPDAINYQILTVLLIEQIKKQKSEINNLKEQLSIISNNVQELINTVNNLPQNQ